MKSNRSDVRKYLERLHSILNSQEFDADRNFVLIRKVKPNEEFKFSTYYTLADLEYENEDVVEMLRQLTVQDYSETLLDTGDVDPPLLFVFCKGIRKKEVYIKIKIRELSGSVICISFHYAKHKMNRPYL